MANTFGRFLPGRIKTPGIALLDKVDHVLSGTDDNATSQRVAISVFVIRVFSAVIAFASQVVLARWMGTFEYGIFVAVWAAIIIAATVVCLGMPSAAVRFVAQYLEQSRPGHLWGMVRGSIGLSFISSSLVAFSAGLILILNPDIMTGYFIMPALLALICLPMLAVIDVVDGVGRPFNWITVCFLPTFIYRPLSILVFFAIMVAILGFAPTAENLMWAAILATYVTGSLQLLLLDHKLRIQVPFEKPLYKIRYWLVVAAPIFLVESFYVMLTSVDVLFVSWLTRPEDTAVYFAATKILALVHFVYFAVRAAASHRYSAYYSTGNMDGLRNFVSQSVAWTFWPSLTIGILMILTGKYFLLLFGNEYVSGAGFLYILVIGIVIRSSVGPAESLLVMTGNQNICAGIYALALITNVVLNISLIPILGLTGAAIATAFAMAFESAALYLAIQRKLGVHAFIVPNKLTAKGAG